MDLSCLSEVQQQELQQLNQQLQQQQVAQADDPCSQVEAAAAAAYNQSTQAYYSYYLNQQQQQCHPDYDYSAYQSTQPDSTPIQPPGVSSAPDSMSSHNAYYPQLQPAAASSLEYQQYQHQQVVEQSNYPGLTPVAAAAAVVAALLQLTHFPGNMDAAERAMVELHHREWLRSGPGPVHHQITLHMHGGGLYHEPFPTRGASSTPMLRWSFYW